MNYYTNMTFHINCAYAIVISVDYKGKNREKGNGNKAYQKQKRSNADLLFHKPFQYSKTAFLCP